MCVACTGILLCMRTCMYAHSAFCCFNSRVSRLLSRSIVETALKFPPVWDLPRMGKLGTLCPMLAEKSPDIDCEQLVEFHVDLMCCNNIGSDPVRSWNPQAPLSPDQYMCSFGVGARHCPAGSASLEAVHMVLAPILAEFRFGRKSPVTEVARTSYLMPTLNFEGALDVTVKLVK